MDIDGSNLRRLTNNEALDGDPRWSPDSRQILFDSDRSGNSDIFVMNALGSNDNAPVPTPREPTSRRTGLRTAPR